MTYNLIPFSTKRQKRKKSLEKRYGYSDGFRNDTNRGKVFIISTFDAPVYIPYSQIRFVRMEGAAAKRKWKRRISPNEAMVGRDGGGGRPSVVFHGESITWVDGRVRPPK